MIGVEHRSHTAACRARLEGRRAEDEKMKPTIQKHDARARITKDIDKTMPNREEALHVTTNTHAEDDDKDPDDQDMMPVDLIDMSDDGETPKK